MSFEYNVASACNKKTDSLLIKQTPVRLTPMSRPFGSTRPGFAETGETYPGQATLWGSNLPSATVRTALGQSFVGAQSGMQLGETPPRDTRSPLRSNFYDRNFAATGSPPTAEIRSVYGFGMSQGMRRPDSSSLAASASFGSRMPEHGRYASRPTTRNPMTGLGFGETPEDRDWATAHRQQFDANLAKTGRPAKLHVPADLSKEFIPRSLMGSMGWGQRCFEESLKKH